MASFSYSELASNVGTATGDGLRNVANTAANFLCNIQANYANFMFQQGDIAGMGSFGKAINSALCGPRSSSPGSPTTPFTGGQCPIRYNVNVTFQYKGSSPSTITLFSVLGPISGVGQGTVAGNQNIYYGVQGAPDPPGYPNGIVPLVQGQPDAINPVKVTINSVTPVSGSDTCGNPPPGYPFETPPSSVVNNNTTVNIGGGTSITVPIALGYASFTANANFNPQFNVNVGPFNVTFDAGGVNITPTLQPTVNFNFPNPQQTPISPTPTPSPGGGGTGTSCDLSPVLTAVQAVKTELDTVKDCACPISYSTAVTTLGTGDSGVYALPTGTIEVRVNLTQIPLNAKTQTGGSASPTIYFCGYISFGDGVGTGDRVAISRSASVFQVPPFATSVTFTLYAGYLATLDAVKVVPSKTGGTLSSRLMYNGPV